MTAPDSPPPRALDLDAIRARTPHTPECALVTTHHLTCTCGAFRRDVELSSARAERTEPATGEDVERVIAAMLEAGGKTKTFHKPEMLDPWVAADVRATAEYILAALDLPGRERALREEIDDLQGKLAELWTIADRQSEGIASLIAERDAANAALADIPRLLDEARTDHARAEAEREWWKEKAERPSDLSDGEEQEEWRVQWHHDDNDNVIWAEQSKLPSREAAWALGHERVDEWRVRFTLYRRVHIRFDDGSTYVGAWTRQHAGGEGGGV